VDRRDLLRAAAVAPAVPLLTSTPAEAAPPSAQRFSLAVLPDTQYLFDADSADPAPLRETFRYLIAERAAVFLTHLGDITEHGTDAEIALAGRTFAALDGKMPYSVLAGNHDVPQSSDDKRGDTPYLRTFGPSRFAGRPTFVGASPDGYNSAHLFRAAGRPWLVLALDWRISEMGITWAQGILDQHRTVATIVATHDLAYPDYAGVAALSLNGTRMWNRLVHGNDQIFLTLNGHHWPPARTVLTNAAGHPVHVHITNYQDRYYGGAGMIRLYRFDLGRNTIEVETFAPWFLARDPARRTPLENEVVELTGPEDKFTVAVDFDRFVSAPPVPAARPASTAIGTANSPMVRPSGIRRARATT
jgi:hypothetical protein